jgi:hypothetical protein
MIFELDKVDVNYLANTLGDSPRGRWHMAPRGILPSEVSSRKASHSTLVDPAKKSFSLWFDFCK